MATEAQVPKTDGTVRRDNIAMVLVRPQIPENIGAAARAMHNMGLGRLHLVAPENCDLSRVLKMATGTSIAIIERMKVHLDLQACLAPFRYVVGTTARTGTRRPSLSGPRDLARDLVGISPRNQVAILFGPEDRGLSNEDLRYCHRLLTIPTDRFSSLNLAHAVLVVAYELYMARVEPPPRPVWRLADRFELDGMYAHLGDVLTRIGFLNPQNPEHWLLNLRHFLSRLPLRARDVRVIRGICRQIDWYAGETARRARTQEKDGVGPGP